MLVNISDIHEAKKALRTVNPKTESYLQLVDSIKVHGVINAITLRKVKDDNGNDILQIVDGLHRYTGAKDAGLTEIPATIHEEMSDMEVMQQQIVANTHKIDTKPVEYSRQLVDILALCPTYTVSSLAKQLGKSDAWLRERLKLVDLAPNVSQLVDEGKINLSNAYALAKLPQDKQEDYINQAITESPVQFVNNINTIKKELDAARLQGRSANNVFVATAYLRKLSEFKDELAASKVAAVLCHQKHLPDSARAGFMAAIEWALHLDQDTIHKDKEAFTEKISKVSKNREQAAAERAQKAKASYIIKAKRSQLAVDEVEAGRDPKDALDAFDKEHSLNKYKPAKEVAPVAETTVAE